MRPSWTLRSCRQRSRCTRNYVTIHVLLGRKQRQARGTSLITVLTQLQPWLHVHNRAASTTHHSVQQGTGWRVF